MSEKNGDKKTIKLVEKPEDKKIEKLAQDNRANRAELKDSYFGIRAMVNSSNRNELKDNTRQNEQEKNKRRKQNDRQEI